MRGGESFAVQIRDPVMDLVVTHCDEAALLTVEGVANRKFVVAVVTVMGEVWGI